MHILRKKLRRDLRQMRGQAIAIASVVACGVASFVAMRAMYNALQRSQTDYYVRYRFADVFADLKRAPLYEADRIRNIPGVAKAEPRVVMDVTLDVPGLAEPAVGRLIGLRAEQQLNALCLRSGRMPGATAQEVIASEAFALANHLDLGTAVPAVINGRWQRLIIVGIAISPEYIYEIRGGGSIFPDNKRFGVLWMHAQALETALNMKGAFNSISATLSPGTREEDVLLRMDHVLYRYGGLGSYGRADQISHRFISDEISQNRISANVIPSIFLGVATLLVHLSFTRLVATQRAQIGVLKAFGYSNWQVGRHYVEYGLAITTGGYALGCGVGWFFGARLASLYAHFYRFPTLIYRPDVGVFAWAAAASGITAIAGTLSAVRRAVVLLPAESMRPEAPPEFRSRLTDRLQWSALSASVRMVLRNLERRPWRALASVFAICCSVMIVVVELGLLDALNHMMDIQFREAQREDIAVSLVEPRGQSATLSLSRLPGVIKSEPYRAVAVKMRSEHRSRRTSLLGFSDTTELRVVVDKDGNRVQIPKGGILISHALASALRVHPGQDVTVEVLEGKRPQRTVRVTGEVDDLFGISAYMALSELNRLLDEDHVISGAMLQVDSGKRQQLYRTLKGLPAVSSVSVRESVIASFQDTLRRSMILSIGTLIVLASIIAIGMIYNGARIALSERARELATLRILGFTQQEVTFVLLGEQGLLTLAALPLGFAAGYGLCRLLAARLATELYRLPVVVKPQSYAWALLLILAAAAGSAILIGRKTAALDIVSVLKAGE